MARPPDKVEDMDPDDLEELSEAMGEADELLVEVGDILIRAVSLVPKELHKLYANSWTTVTDVRRDLDTMEKELRQDWG